MFPTQGIQYSQVCGRNQVGAPQAFRYVIQQNNGNPHTFDDPYVDGLSLTYGSPHIHKKIDPCVKLSIILLI